MRAASLYQFADPATVAERVAELPEQIVTPAAIGGAGSALTVTPTAATGDSQVPSSSVT